MRIVKVSKRKIGVLKKQKVKIDRHTVPVHTPLAFPLCLFSVSGERCYSPIRPWYHGAAPVGTRLPLPEPVLEGNRLGTGNTCRQSAVETRETDDAAIDSIESVSRRLSLA